MSSSDAGAEGVEHLQRAAREMVAAARSFLDAVEGVVEDRDALKEVSTTVAGFAATVGDVIGDAVRGGRPAPWVDSASRSDKPADSYEPTGTDAPVRASEGASSPSGAQDASVASDSAVPGQADSASHATGGSGDSTGDSGDSDDETEDWARSLVDPDRPKRPSRVRRISVE